MMHYLQAFSELREEDRDMEEFEDEEEDLDFNPFLKDNPSLEASSSLSSEVEVLESNSSKTNEVWNYSVGNFEHSEEVIMRNFESGSEIRMPRKARRKCEKNKFDSRFQVENQTLDGERENGSPKNVNDGDNDDAICKRTRARYSLTSFTLDELETFLQETDDEDDLHNVDDEEEYRKFLAAVLQGGDGDGQSIRENENVDDEDEDNDADFEIELEELLESDVDGVVRDKGQKLECERGTRRPETRQNRRQKASSRYRGKFLGQSKRLLRPRLPVYPCGGVVPCPAIDGNVIASSYQLSSTEDCLVNGFVARVLHGYLSCSRLSASSYELQYAQYEKQPLFCLPNIPSLAESNNDLLRGAVPPIATPWTPTLREQQI